MTKKGHKQTDEHRAKHSEWIVGAVLDGSFNPHQYGISGVYKSQKNGLWIHFRSRLEAGWYHVFEKDPRIMAFGVEPFDIEYHHPDGSAHSYVPDLLTASTDGTLVLIEFKPEVFWTDPVNLAKWAAAQEYCKTQGLTFRVLGYEKLKDEGFEYLTNNKEFDKLEEAGLVMLDPK